MADLREIQLPEWVTDIPSMKAVIDVGEKYISQLMDDMEELQNDIFIDTSTEYGIARREKIAGITPLSTDSLDDRRVRLKTRYYETFPYTFMSMKNSIERITSKDLIMILDTQKQKLHVEIPLDRKNSYDAVCEMIERMTPLMIVTEIIYRWKRWKEYLKTWEMVKGETWQELREGKEV